jgi:hypothetical protein
MSMMGMVAVLERPLYGGREHDYPAKTISDNRSNTYFGTGFNGL